MKPTFPLLPSAQRLPHSPADSGAECHGKADIEHAQPEAARRFRALMAKQQGATETAKPPNGIANDDTPGQTEKADEAETGQSPEDAVAPTANDNFRSNGRSDAGDPADKRSWGVRFTPPATPSSMPSTPRGSASTRDNPSAISIATRHSASRRPSRTRTTVNATAASTHELRAPLSDGNDLATSRAEALSHLVTQLLSKQAPIDRDALAQHTSVDADHSDIGTVISIRVDHVFPETLLTLTISEPAISLRFQSASADSRALLSNQRNELASRVTHRTGRPTEIEIVG
jgi:hypothetical protein